MDRCGLGDKEEWLNKRVLDREEKGKMGWDGGEWGEVEGGGWYVWGDKGWKRICGERWI